MEKFDVIVIGGGASGMIAALSAKKHGASVCILEKNVQLGKKLLSTGNGRCNFTNENLDMKYFHTGNENLVASVLHDFSLERTLVFFSGIGILARNKNGYYYPRSNQAAGVRHCLSRAVMARGIDIRPNTIVQMMDETDDLFHIKTSQEMYAAKSVIICCGGKAAPSTGSDGMGYTLAGEFGHSVITPLPALVQLCVKETYFHQLKGIRAAGSVYLNVDGERVAGDTGELQFTKQGISGIPVFNISRYATVALNENRHITAVLDLFPEFTQDVLEAQLSQQLLFHNFPISIKDGLVGMMNDGLIPVLLQQLGLDEEESSFSLSTEDIGRMAQLFKNWEVTITKSLGFEEAQVTCGGVDMDEVTLNLESKYQHGLFFAGEVLDVDGSCGGYNLQWAWSSGYVAGRYAAYFALGGRKE